MSARNHMKTLSRFALIGAVSATVGACSSDDEGSNNNADGGVADAGGNGDTGMGGEIISVTESTIISDTTWTTGNTYVLSDLTFVAANATLTIEPGTTVVGQEGTALVVSRDGMIMAEGTADAPIVFTSAKPEGSRQPGDWGGLVLLGDAPNNAGTDQIEGMESSDLSQHGGTNAAHNCGTLRYVRIEYGGFVFGEDNELNGLTVGSCGSDTVLDYVQVSNGLDDGIEFFGGTANLSHAVVYRAQDDSIDWDQGWAGNVQFLIVQQDPANSDHGIEADNDANEPDKEPRSNPTLYNVTFVGGDGNPDQLAWKLRRGTAGFLGNAIITGFGGGAIDIDSPESAAQYAEGNLGFDGLILFDNGADGATHFNVDGATCAADADCPADSDGNPGVCSNGTCADDDNGFDEAAEIGGIATVMIDTDPMLGDAFNPTAPDFAPAAGSPAANGVTPPSTSFFDNTATFIGAIEPGGDDWTTGWTSFTTN